MSTIGPYPSLKSPYRMLARTCRKCGRLLTTPDHLIRKDAGRLPNCRHCQSVNLREWSERNPGKLKMSRRKNPEVTRRWLVEQQRETSEDARNHKKEWTGPELEIAARDDLSTREAAEKLGRTYISVETMRRKLKRDPRKARLAGLRSGVADKAAP